MGGVPEVIVKDIKVVCNVVRCHFGILVRPVGSVWLPHVWPEVAVNQQVFDGVVLVWDIQVCVCVCAAWVRRHL